MPEIKRLKTEDTIAVQAAMILPILVTSVLSPTQLVRWQHGKSENLCIGVTIVSLRNLILPIRQTSEIFMIILKRFIVSKF